MTLTRIIAWSAALVLALGAATPAPRFTIATAPYAFVFPADHASHPGYQSEWWYYTGHLRTAGGRTFGYELTFFRFGLRPAIPSRAKAARWRGHELFPAHFAITDERGNAFFYDVRFAREALSMGAAAQHALRVHAEDWSLAGSPLPGRPAFERMVLHARDDTSAGVDALDLVQIPLKPPAIHGHGGVSRKAACRSCASHYYSYTRLRTTGSLEYDGAHFAVTGTSWMDHEYGSAELQSNETGWDWFSLQLDDGREVMAYLLRQKDGTYTPQSSGSLIERDGRVRYLPRNAFSVAVTGSWHSPHTGATYPSGWRLRVPSADIDVRLDPTVLDQELAVTSGGVSYWEGSVAASDPATGRALGSGYVELTGYANSVSL